MNNKKLSSLIVVLFAQLLLASSDSVSAAAAAGAGAGAKPSGNIPGAASGSQEKEKKEPLSWRVGGGEVAIAYSPDGKWLVAVSATSASPIVFKVDKKTQVLEPIGGNLPPAHFSRMVGQSGELGSVAFSPDGNWVVAVQPPKYDITLFKFDTSTGLLQSKYILLLFDIEDFGSVVYSPDGQKIAFASQAIFAHSNLRIIDVNKQAEMMQDVKGSPFKIGKKGPIAIAYSPDGKWITIINHNDNGLQVFKVNERDGAIQKINGSPFTVTNVFHPNFKSVAYSPDGNWVTAINYTDGKLVVFRVNKDTGALQQIPESPFQSSKHSNLVAYAPNGAWIATADFDKISIFGVNRDTGALQQIPGSPFVDKGLNRGTTGSLVYSPDGDCIAITKHDGTILIYEVDQETGALEQITGDVLKGADKQRYKKAKLVLENKEIMSQSAMPKDVLGVLHEYVVGPHEKPNNDLPKTQTGVMQGAIDLARKQQKESQGQIAQLFAEIKEGKIGNVDRAGALLTPFTINARDDERNTPLIMAASHQRNAIVQKILAYEGKIQRDEYHADIVRADLKAINGAKNSALKLALVHNNYAIARMIAQEMYDRYSKDKKQPYLNVDERNEALAMVLMAVDQNNVDVIRLIELLQKD